MYVCVCERERERAREDRIEKRGTQKKDRQTDTYTYTDMQKRSLAQKKSITKIEGRQTERHTNTTLTTTTKRSTVSRHNKTYD